MVKYNDTGRLEMSSGNIDTVKNTVLLLLSLGQNKTQYVLTQMREKLFTVSV